MDIQRKTVKFVVTAGLLIVLFSFGIILARGEGPGREATIGERFHNETSMTWRGVLGDVFSSKPKKPDQYKLYPNTARTKLPQPSYNGLTVEQAIGNRRSVRNYSKKPLSLAQLSQLLFAAQGVTGKAYGKHFRSAPSAGALYPFEIYVVVNNVQDLPAGIYHYAVLDHALELLKEGDLSKQITKAGLDQDMLGASGATFVLSAIFDRVLHKYGQRGHRYVYIEAGHISQNIYLQSVSLGLGSVSVGAFFDEKVNKLIGLDGRDEAAIYLHAVGTL